MDAAVSSLSDVLKSRYSQGEDRLSKNVFVLRDHFADRRELKQDQDASLPENLL